MHPHQLPGISAGYVQHPQAVPNMLTGGYLPQQFAQVDQMGLQRREVEAFDRTNRSNKSTSEDEGGVSDNDRSQGERDRDATGRRQSLENRSGGSSENDGGDRVALTEREEREEQNKKQRKGSQEEYEEETNAVPSKTKKHRMQKKGSSSSSGSNQSEPKTVKFIQPEVHQSLPVPGQGSAMISPPTPIPSGRVISTPIPGQQADPATGAARKEGSSDNANINGNEAVEQHAVTEKKKKGEMKGGKKKQRERSRSPSLERTQPKDQFGQLKGDYQGISEEHVEDQYNSAVYGEVTVSRVESPPSLSEVEERSKFVQFPSPAKGARRPVIAEDHGMGYDNHLANGSQDM